MTFPQSFLRSTLLPIGLLLLSCVNETEDPKTAPVKPVPGIFLVNLVEPTDITQGFTSVLGRLYTGVSPSTVSWSQTATGGSCKLYTPKIPFCSPGCGSSAACVDDGKCEAYPTSVSVGQVDVKGIKTKAGATTFSMSPVNNNYQAPGGTILEFPPFAEGEMVTFSAAGDTATGPFTVTAQGIPPLKVLNDSIVLTDGKAITLQWTPPTKAVGTKVSAVFDISHHGGTKGKLECEGADNGSMEIAGDLLDKLKALGMAGFPKVDVIRKGVGTHAVAKVDIVLESKVSKELSIPGLISCSGDEECPTGQTCQADLRCK